MTSGAEAVKAAILTANTDENRWMVEARTDLLDELLDDNFVLVHMTGYQQPKAEWLEAIRSGEMTYHDIREQSASVELEGDLALLTARNLVTATIWGTRSTWRLEMRTTYALEDGVWRPVHSRATTF